MFECRALSVALPAHDGPRAVLREVSFEVARGEVVGIVGPNGAGKSTLLKILTGNLTQTSGTFDVRGKISALLSLTSFLNPDQTGLENIRFNLVVNGAAKADIPTLTEEIVDFTELGAFIRAPVRTYSSGMMTRLAFGISTAITPDILVIDEVLGAGDAYFAAKATVRMLELTRRGRALLFVSHSINAVQMLCDTAIWIDNGQVREIGPVDEIARRYEAEFRRKEDEHLRAGNARRASALSNAVHPEEIGRADVWRLRVTGESGRLQDTHYVRAVEIELAGRTHDVSLEFADLDDPDVHACLDLASSEWARVHDRHGTRSRALAPGSSKLRGGQIVARTPVGVGQVGAVAVEIESQSLGGTEELKVQYADTHTGEWRDLALVSKQSAGDDWSRSRFEGSLMRADEEAHARQVARISDVVRADVTIEEVRLLVGGRTRLAVQEREPFAIEVDLHVERPIELADVWLQFTRVDGFYVFWQSSGQVEGGNLRDLDSDVVVRFDFDPNLFGPGDYEVEAAVANGFDLDRNWPHSEVYDRRIGALKFTVSRERQLVLFGPVNHTFPVTVRPASAVRRDEPVVQSLDSVG